MTTCRDDQLRRGPQGRQRLQCRPHARPSHAPVVGPLVLSLLVQAGAVGLAVLFGFSLVEILGVVVLITVLTTIASRRTVGSLLAGAGLRVAQPYGPGEQIRVFVPALNSVEDAEIVRVGPANTTLMTASGMVLVPNVDMLRGDARS